MRIDYKDALEFEDSRTKTAYMEYISNRRHRSKELITIAGEEVA